MQEKFMRVAIELAVAGAAHGDWGPFGAVVVHNDKIVGRGCNRVVSHCDPTAHAEIVAIREACRTLSSYSLQGCELYTSCEPCPMCLGAAYWARLDYIYFAATQEDASAADFDDAFLYAELAKPLVERQLPMRRLLAEEGLAPFLEWARNPKKIPY